MVAKPPKTFRPEFGNLLRDILTKQDIGVREFGRKAGDFDPGFLAGVLSAKRPPPLAQFPFWCDILKLKGEQRRQFLEYGYLTHCPDEVWRLVESLQAENKRLKQRAGVE